ncbi:MAG: hypothetical protein PHW52_03630 [Candidatus Pacebacteria bacterium]|nr:hypothetical protein [Candidatus Paceibacterota bacterium]
MKKILLIILFSFLLANVSYAKGVVYSDISVVDVKVKTTMIKIRDGLIYQKDHKGTYSGFLESKKGIEIVSIVNAEGLGKMTAFTSKNAFCIMKKVYGDGYYCIDSSGYEGNISGCSKVNIACVDPIIIKANKESVRADIIRMIMDLIVKRHNN